MNLEHQVTNKDLSKRLKELGVKQDSHWVYFHNMNIDKEILMPNLGCNKSVGEKYYSAFGVSELGEKLPAIINDHNIRYIFEIGKDKQNNYNIWYCDYFDYSLDKLLITFRAKTLTDAMGSMLEYLIVNGYVKVGDKK